MKNYLSLNGKEIALTDAQVEDIKKSFGLGSKELGKVDVGKTAKLGEFEVIVLEHSAETTAVILKDLYKESEEFGKNNNFDGSYVDKYCKEFERKLAKIIGSENIIEHKVDLTADDGLKCYGAVRRKVSLLTADLYRRYVYILDEYNPDKWWWLATPWSTPKHGYSSTVKCVAPSGNVYDNFCHYYGGVRPFCILKSSIFVSE